MRLLIGGFPVAPAFHTEGFGTGPYEDAQAISPQGPPKRDAIYTTHRKAMRSPRLLIDTAI
jgi:hypothetical protein